MKKITFLFILMLATWSLSADNILHFTYSQAARTVACLNAENELMIYCGYENELPTYVLINEVWAEQVTSSYYEIWIYGYDAYTGEEIYMPIDLECIYLYGSSGIYSAAQYLRFRYSHTRPTFAWTMPPYNPFTRAPRPATYYYTYHYDIHHPGWHYSQHPEINYHPYYQRCVSCTAPIPPRYTPGQEKPGFRYISQGKSNSGFEYSAPTRTQNVSCRRSYTPVQNDPSSRQGNRITSNRSNNTITSTDRTTGRSTTSAAPSRTTTSSRSTTETPARSTTSNSRTSDNNGRSSNSNRSSSTVNNNNNQNSDRNNGNGRSSNSSNRNSGNSSRSTVSPSTPTAQPSKSTPNKSSATTRTSTSGNTRSSSSNTSRSSISSTSRSSSNSSSSNSTSRSSSNSSSTSRSSSNSSSTSRSSSNTKTAPTSTRNQSSTRSSIGNTQRNASSQR